MTAGIVVWCVTGETHPRTERGCGARVRERQALQNEGDQYPGGSTTLDSGVLCVVGALSLSPSRQVIGPFR